MRTLDIAKRLLDHGMHPPTVYFPLLVDEALMVEPTETEAKESLDALRRRGRVDPRRGRGRPRDRPPGARTRRRSAASTRRGGAQPARPPAALTAPQMSVDDKISELGDWRGEMSNPTDESYKDKVKLTFAKGASLDDPAGLFNASLDAGTRPRSTSARAIGSNRMRSGPLAGAAALNASLPLRLALAQLARPGALELAVHPIGKEAGRREFATD